MGDNIDQNKLTEDEISVLKTIIKSFQGAQGIRGCKGIQGVRGMDGVQGVQGIAGRQGAQGVRGCKGIPGVRGMDGAQGVQGIRGKRGKDGSRGYQGYDGTVGIQGLDGEDAIISVDGIRLTGTNSHLFVFNKDKFVPKSDLEKSSVITFLENAKNYTYTDRGYIGDIGLKGTVVYYHTTPENMEQENGGAIMNDFARFLGGIYRANEANNVEQVKTIICGGNKYIWDENKNLLGSNYFNGNTSLVSVIVSDFQANKQVDDKTRDITYNCLLSVNSTIITIRVKVSENNTWENEINSPNINNTDNSEYVNKLSVKDGSRINIWLDESAWEWIKDSNTIPIDNFILNTKEDDAHPCYYTKKDNNTKDYLSNHITDSDINGIIELVYYEDAWYYSGGLNNDNSKTTEDIKITGVGEIGGYKDGNTIDKGTNLNDFIKKLVQKQGKITSTDPSINLSVGGGLKFGNSYIINSTISYNNLTVSLNEGSYGCEGGTTVKSLGNFNKDLTFKYNNDNMAAPNGSIKIGEGTKIIATQTFIPTEITIQDNLGGELKHTYNEGNNKEVRDEKNIYGCYPVYYWFIEYSTNNNYSITNIPTQGINHKLIPYKTNKLIITTLTSTSTVPTFVLAVPVGYKITSITNSLGIVLNSGWVILGQEIQDQWRNGFIPNIIISQKPIEYKNITIVKQ